MKVADIMSKNVTLIQLETPLKEAAEKMKAEDIGSIPVTDGEKIKGMLTDRDIVTRAIAVGKDVSSTAAKDVMTEKICYVFDDEEIDRAAEAMKDNQIRRLVVLDRNKRLVGMISLGDLASHGDNENLSAGVVKCVSETSAEHAVH